MPRLAKTGKRRYRRGRRRNRARRSRSRYLMPKEVISAKKFIKFYYRDVLTLTAINPADNTYHRFAVNDIFDPDVTGIGAQPPMFDNLMAMYNRFKVHGCRMTIKAHCNTSDLLRVGVVYRGIDTTNIYSPLAYDPESAPLSSSQVIGPGQSAPIQPQWKSIYCNFNKLAADYESSINYVGTPTSSPTTRLYGDVYCQNLSLNSNINAWVEVVMCFYCELTNANTTELVTYD